MRRWPEAEMQGNLPHSSLRVRPIFKRRKGSKSAKERDHEWLVVGGESIGLFLKRIVEIGVVAAKPHPGGAGEVGGDEEESPALVLSDMDKFMTAAVVEIGARSGENDVAEGHGRGAAGDWDAAEQALEQAAVEFED